MIKNICLYVLVMFGTILLTWVLFAINYRYNSERIENKLAQKYPEENRGIVTSNGRIFGNIAYADFYVNENHLSFSLPINDSCSPINKSCIRL